ncbi:MAG: MurR/RpiR family transcriptional regulator [Blautia sp.]|nr:MurR/RpiR family transcriptional regulator [Blautia sp.]
MTTNVLEAITEKYHSLTRSGKKLADYIFAHTTESQYLSITSLAENCDVSEATITRFCRALGYPSYNAFKLALAQADHVTDLGDPTACNEPITSKDSTDTMCRKVHAANIAALNETLELLDEGSLMNASRLLASSERVYCFGQGGSNIMAMEAWARFSTATSNFIHITDSHMQAMAVALATPKDAILFFSYSGSTKDMEDIFNVAQERKVPIILITHFPKSRAAEFAQIILQCGYNESPLQSGSISAKVGQLFLIDCLFYGFCRQNPELRAAARSSTAKAIANKLL